MIGGCKKYPRGVKGGESRYLDLEREREWWVERERGDGISGYPDIYNSYLIFSFKNVN